MVDEGVFFVRVVADIVRVVLVINLRLDAVCGLECERERLRRADIDSRAIAAGEHVAVCICRRADCSVCAERSQVAACEIERIKEVGNIRSLAVPDFNVVESDERSGIMRRGISRAICRGDASTACRFRDGRRDIRPLARHDFVRFGRRVTADCRSDYHAIIVRDALREHGID